jgi:hypothetical protein
VVDTKEMIKDGVKGINIEYSCCMKWKSSPFLKGVITSFGMSQATKNVEDTTALMRVIFKTNPVIPANKGSVLEDREIGPFEMGNLYREEIDSNRNER